VSNPGAGYSGTPLPRKLGIAPGARVLFAGAPDDFADTLGELPPGLTVRTRLTEGATFDVIVAFCGRRAQLERGLERWRAALEPAGGLWIGWPKKSSGVATDLTENDVRAQGLAAGLVDNKVCAIDATWSGLRLVYRLADRRRAQRST
jgi:hypothetical protein